MCPPTKNEASSLGQGFQK